MKKIVIILLCLFYAANSYSEVRIGFDIGDKFNYNTSSSQELSSFNSIMIAPTVEIKVLDGLNLLFEIEIARLLGFNFNFMSTTYIFGVYYNTFITDSLFLRPGIKIGLFGTASYSGEELKQFPDSGPFIDLNLSFGKQIHFFEILFGLSWRKETSNYSAVCANLGARFVF